MILRESTWPAVAGIVVGVGATLGLTRLVKSMLYGIDPLASNDGWIQSLLDLSSS